MAESIADGHLSIGEVLGVLLQEFPDVTISKIRFLESQGLIAPERTPSGYRKFYSDDVDLLRVILTEQRENYLPLRVIKDRLDSGEIDPTGEHLRPVLEGATKPVPPSVPTTDEAASATTVVEALKPPTATKSAPAPSDNGSDNSSDNSSDNGSNKPEVATLVPPLSAVGDAAAESGSIDSAAPPAPSIRSLTSVTTSVTTAKTGPAATTSPSTAPSPKPSDGLTQPTDLRPPSEPEQATDEPSDPPPSEEVPVTSVASHPAARSTARRDERRAASPRLLPGVMLDAGELCGMVGITRAELEELEAFGIVVGRDVIGGRVYTEDAVEIAKPAGALLHAGVDSRHLRAWRTAAEREASLYEQLIAPRLRQRNPEARAEAMAQLSELEATGDALHDALVRSALRPHFEA